MPEILPLEERVLAQQKVEQLLRLWERSRSAQQAARTVVEGDLRRVNKQLEKQGLIPKWKKDITLPRACRPRACAPIFRA